MMKGTMTRTMNMRDASFVAMVEFGIAFGS